MSAGFCTHCSFVVESFDGLTCCPQCGSKGKPCATEDQVSVNVNVHELRLLCIWAENWAHLHKNDPHTGPSQPPPSEMPEVVYAIAARLRRQLGSRDCSLTMRDEFAELKEKFPDFETNHQAADNPETGDCYRPDDKN